MSVSLGQNSKRRMRNNKNSSTNKNTLQEAAVAYPAVAKAGVLMADPFGQNNIQKAVAMLGAATIKALKQVHNDADLINCIRLGLPRKALNILMTITGLTINEITNILHISDRTLRRYADDQKLNAEQTERLIEIAKLYSRGEEVFGSLDVFKEWMDSTVMALGNKKPKAFLDTSLGINMLMDELGRIEYGVFA